MDVFANKALKLQQLGKLHKKNKYGNFGSLNEN